jgi:hypothetical protein
MPPEIAQTSMDRFQEGHGALFWPPYDPYGQYLHAFAFFFIEGKEVYMKLRSKFFAS